MEKLKYSLKHEKIILGTMLRDKDTRNHLCLALQAGEFHSDIHKTIFAGLQQLIEDKLDYTPPTLMTILPDTDWGGKEYLEKLEKMGDARNVDHHVTRMRWDQARVEVYDSRLPEFVAELKDPRSDIDETITLGRQLGDRLQEARGKKWKVTGKGASSKYSASMRARQVGVTFRSSGYPAIDKNLVAGFAKGKTTVVCGAPSSGKTSFSLNTARKQAKTWKVGILPWESGVQDALDLMCSSHLKIPLEKFEKLAHLLKDEEQRNIDDYVASLLDNENIAFLKPPPRTVRDGRPWEINDRVLDWVESEIDDWDRDIVYWDLFEKRLVDHSPNSITNALNRVQEMVVPDRLNIHMVLLHQLNLKEVERRQDERPTRDALKGTSAYIEVPDLVLGMYRPAVYDPGVQDNIIEIICLKQRKGVWPWKVICKWQGQYTRISGGRQGTLVITKDERDEYRDGI